MKRGEPRRNETFRSSAFRTLCLIIGVLTPRRHLVSHLDATMFGPMRLYQLKRLEILLFIAKFLATEIPELINDFLS